MEQNCSQQEQNLRAESTLFGSRLKQKVIFWRQIRPRTSEGRPCCQRPQPHFFVVGRVLNKEKRKLSEKKKRKEEKKRKRKMEGFEETHKNRWLVWENFFFISLFEKWANQNGAKDEKNRKRGQVIYGNNTTWPLFDWKIIFPSFFFQFSPKSLIGWSHFEFFFLF